MNPVYGSYFADPFVWKHQAFFYPRDFLNQDNKYRPGTALMVTRMKSMTELEGAGRIVLRARSDWQRFQASRGMHWRVWDWRTLEGTFVVRREGGGYDCFYSGGRWETETYGVGYGLEEHMLGPYSDTMQQSRSRSSPLTGGICPIAGMCSERSGMKSPKKASVPVRLTSGDGEILVLRSGVVGQPGLEIEELLREARVAHGHDLDGQETRVSGPADGDGRDRNAAGHLHDREE